MWYRPRTSPVTRVLVLSPTRELAAQCYAVATKLAQFTDITFSLIVGKCRVFCYGSVSGVHDGYILGVRGVCRFVVTNQYTLLLLHTSRTETAPDNEPRVTRAKEPCCASIQHAFAPYSFCFVWRSRLRSSATHPGGLIITCITHICTT